MDFFSALSSYPALLISTAALLGLFVGSFLNVVIYRLPVMMERRWQMECASLTGSNLPENNEETFNLIVPRSRCPVCKTPISAIQNIPVLSWLIQGGKCRHCQTRISYQYPLVEIITALLTALAAYYFGATGTALMAILFIWALIALSVIDFNTTLLPDDITLPLLWLGLLCNTTGLFTDLHSAVIGAACGYMILWLVYHAFLRLTGKEGMGYGDFKLLAALGAWLGWQQLPMIILLSSLLGAIIGIGLIVLRGRDKNIPIPFGPYLAGAGLICLLWGEQLNHYYLQLSI